MNDNKPISLSGLKRKDIKAYETLFFQYHGRLVLFANKFTGDLRVSQDLVQDTFLKLWEKPGIISTIKSPKAYLFQAVRNSCLNHRRHLNIKHSAEEKLVAKIDLLEKGAYFNSYDPLHSLLELEIDEKIDEIVQSNNLAENAVRPFALGRKNYLFAGSNRGAERAAMFHSFFGTCKKNGVNPFDWLKTTLERIPSHKANKLHELLPLTNLSS